MRRFELIKGNQARFWEIARHSNVLVTCSGRIGSAGKTVEKTFDDFMAAEVEFDRLIRDKLRKDFVEVDEPSDPPEPPAERAVILAPLDGSEPVEFSGPAMRYLIWRMVEAGIMDRQREAPDIERWAFRAMRRAGLKAIPDKGDKDYDAWLEVWRSLTVKDRSAPMVGLMVGAFKFSEGSHWIVTGRECRFIADDTKGRSVKRHKPKVREQAWVDEWIAIHDRSVKGGGYEVIPVDE